MVLCWMLKCAVSRGIILFILVFVIVLVFIKYNMSQLEEVFLVSILLNSTNANILHFEQTHNKKNYITQVKAFTNQVLDTLNTINFILN